jgi:hypothetical protein
LYNINPTKIFLFTGNFLDVDDGINVIPIFLLDTGWDYNTGPKNITDFQIECFKNLEKIRRDKNIGIHLKIEQKKADYLKLDELLKGISYKIKNHLINDNCIQIYFKYSILIT